MVQDWPFTNIEIPTMWYKSSITVLLNKEDYWGVWLVHFFVSPLLTNWHIHMTDPLCIVEQNDVSPARDKHYGWPLGGTTGFWA